MRSASATGKAACLVGGRVVGREEVVDRGRRTLGELGDDGAALLGLLTAAGSADASVSMPAVVVRGSLSRIGVSEATRSSHCGWPSSGFAAVGVHRDDEGALREGLRQLGVDLGGLVDPLDPARGVGDPAVRAVGLPLPQADHRLDGRLALDEVVDARGRGVGLVLLGQGERRRLRRLGHPQRHGRALGAGLAGHRRQRGERDRRVAARPPDRAARHRRRRGARPRGPTR